MPGYLSNRRIAFDPTAEVAGVIQDISDLDTRVTAAEEAIEDLELQISI